MKRTSTILLQSVIVLFGIAVLAVLLVEPNFEGVNANATFFEVYFDDPFLAYVYLGSVPFFVALYQAIRLLGNVGRSDGFSPQSVRALRTIRMCALLTAGAIVGAIAYLMIFIGIPGTDDPAGAVALGIVATVISVVVAVAVSVFEKTLQSAVELKAERDLVV